jgi:hypothetical protein
MLKALLAFLALITLIPAALSATCDNPVQLETRTCQQIGQGCVEVIPGQSGNGYEYDPAQGVYIFRQLSNADHYFLLMGDITCEKTCVIFQFQEGNPSTDATTVLDLNGHTMTYSNGYPVLVNNGFEQWSGNSPAGWNIVSGAAEPRSTYYWMPMTGQHVLYSPGAITLESSALDLPENRVYSAYATIGRAEERDVTIEVLDSNNNVVCTGRSTNGWLFRGQTIACQFKGSGSYRIRLKTLGYAYFDMTGIVPYNDYGVGVFTSWSLSESNTYQNRIVDNLAPLAVPGSGDYANPSRLNHLEVKNGKIIAGSENQDSIGVHVSGTTDLHLHNVEIHTKGLKSHTFEGGGSIHDNYLDAQIPWYFSRENSDEENGLFWGGEYYNNLAVGGQGVIRLAGQGTRVYDNCLRNNAQATNHYAIIHSGAEDAEIYGNIFDPIEGSGILTYVGHGYRIHDNIFHVRTAPCNVEYLNEDYSTNGIRMNDYGSGDNHDNWVYDNEFIITGEFHDTAWDNCIPVTTGIFYSASGSHNRVFNNTFMMTNKNKSDNAPVFALYIGGDAHNNAGNRLFVGNRFETNDKAIWISSFYGDSSSIWLENNTFIREDNTFYSPESPDSAIRFGYYNHASPGMKLVNNYFDGFLPDSYYFTATSASAAYDIEKSHYLHFTVTEGGSQRQGITVSARSSQATVTGTTDAQGSATLMLVEYKESGDMRPTGTHNRAVYNPYEVIAGSESFGNVAADGEKWITLALGTGSIVQNNCGDADSDRSGTVSSQEMISFSTAWKAGTRTMAQLMRAIREWKGGC